MIDDQEHGDELIDGELIDYDSGAAPEYIPGPEDPFSAFLFPTMPFGELLKHIRDRVGQAAGREVTQEQFGKLLGNVDQITVSRWQTGKQKPHQAQLKKIVALAHEYGMRGLTLAKLEQSLHRDVDQYATIDPRVLRLNTLLLVEDEEFKTKFFEVVIAIFHILKGASQSQGK